MSEDVLAMYDSMNVRFAEFLTAAFAVSAGLEINKGGNHTLVVNVDAYRN